MQTKMESEWRREARDMPLRTHSVRVFEYVYLDKKNICYLYFEMKILVSFLYDSIRREKINVSIFWEGGGGGGGWWVVSKASI